MRKGVMYSEDRFHPTNNDDNYLKELIEQKIKPSNKTSECTVKCFKLNNPVKVKCYKSGDIGSTIVDAVTGAPFYEHKVGSKYEYLYFKVKRDFDTFFYHSPEEYEKHQYTDLTDEIKKNWREKFSLAKNSVSSQ